MSRLLVGNLTRFLFFVTAVSGGTGLLNLYKKIESENHCVSLVCGFQHNSKIESYRLNTMTRVWGIMEMSDFIGATCFFLQFGHSQWISVGFSKNVSRHCPNSIGSSFSGSPSMRHEIRSNVFLSFSHIWQVILWRIWPWKMSEIILCWFSMLCRNSLLESLGSRVDSSWISHRK